MKTVRSVIAVAVLATGMAGAVWAQGMKGHGHEATDTKAMEKMQPTASDAASTKDFKAAHMKMMDGMHVEYIGNSDVDFVQGMIPHHQGAIDMAKVQLQHGKDPELRKMAQKIISDQEKEIAEMQAWLKKNKK
jgi:uncharacterized protein (DUF305 family)